MIAARTLVPRLLGEVQVRPGVAGNEMAGVIGVLEGVDLAIVINAVV